MPNALLRIWADAVAAEKVPDEPTMVLHPVSEVFVGHAISEYEYVEAVPLQVPVEIVAISPTENTVTESVKTGAMVFTGSADASTELDTNPIRT